MNSKLNGKASAAEAPEKDKQTETRPSTVSVNENGKLNQEQEQKLLTVDEKIQKLTTLNELVARREQFKNHLGKVQGMRFDDFEDKNIITLGTQSNANGYQIKSTYLCERIAGLLTEEFTQRIKEVEALIAF